VGGHVVRELRSIRVPFAALVRDRRRGKRALGSEIELREGDYENAAGLTAAFEGAERVFLVAPLVPRLAELESQAIDAAVQAGVAHIVKLSTAGVTSATGEAVPRQYPLHRAAKEHLERSGVAFTHLRPGPFIQNTLNFAPSIAAEGVFRGAWGEGGLGYVDVRDVAAVAARVLTEPGHDGQAYELTGPEALGPPDIAAKLSAALGREVRYEDVPPAAVHRAMSARGMPEWFVGAMVEVMEHTRTGAAAHVTSAISDLTARPPRTYDEFAREFANVFAGA
jgi:uncharacterized protein YbjT (DUF2867 family)